MSPPGGDATVGSDEKRQKGKATPDTIKYVSVPSLSTALPIVVEEPGTNTAQIEWDVLPW